ncbi:hypothetical protein [Pseudomonas vancouverensis]|uniref:Uncharacterized protein n=1 Tax=Pseudomonas vancouverensis TaxID=95300 RepID=A0A4R4JUJ5_PSEVA|nr:hypothetical protein [Pseudomonas vancouverensis]KAB0493894.1 hypothetical protein F7R09_22920 [Pseudomonas vancouverensis]TDB57199.1 hypothetical protein EIY72_26630 [Pseudomonas vancouverensis]
MTLSAADTLFLVIGVVDISGMFAGIGYMLFLANTKMDLLQKAFKNSWGVTGAGYGGVWAKLMVVGRISGYVTFSTFYIDRGVVSADDLKNLPISLRRKLMALQWGGIVLLTVMFGLALAAELNVV